MAEKEDARTTKARVVGKVLKAKYGAKTGKPVCPNCLAPLKPITLDYGLAPAGSKRGQYFFVWPCSVCGKPVRYNCNVGRKNH